MIDALKRIDEHGQNVGYNGPTDHWSKMLGLGLIQRGFFSNSWKLTAEGRRVMESGQEPVDPMKCKLNY